MKTVLFAWERGHGFGHAVRLRRIATRLRPHGVRLIAFVRNPSAMNSHRDAFAEIAAVPPWPIDQLSEPHGLRRSSATMNDMLSEAGLADGEAVGRILSAWDKVFVRTRPDLVVADYAPLAALVARGRIPVMIIGNGFTVPPAEMPRFPLLHRQAPPTCDEARTLGTVNAAAAKLGLRRLDRLPQLFSGDARLVQTFRLLDPYDTQRVSGVDGPVFEEPPIARAADAEQVFAYLSNDSHAWRFMLQELISVAGRLRIHAPSWPKAPLDELAKAGAQVDMAPQPIAGVLAASRLVIHLGGHGLAAEALVAGVPQLLLPDHIEHDLYSEAIERTGVGRLVKTHLSDTQLEPGTIQSLMNDRAMSARADAIGSRLRESTARHDALTNCESVCMALLDGMAVNPGSTSGVDGDVAGGGARSSTRTVDQERIADPTQRFRVHQIFYDEPSRGALDPRFIPLDNTQGRPDWYEFWPILQFLRSNKLDEDRWYGFLSTRFEQKTGLNSASVFRVLDSICLSHDVALFPLGVGHILYFKNIFEQGESSHPNLINLSKKFIAQAGLDIDLDTLVSHSGNACLSNFIVAKAPYWNEWRRLAESFFAFAEDSLTETGIALREPAPYFRGPTPMKVFIQERLSALVLARGHFRVFSMPLTFSLNTYPPAVFETLAKIDEVKRKISTGGSPALSLTLDELRQCLKFDRSTNAILPAAKLAPPGVF
jgi:UDP:flavonoid glycosyltransferase YjiC (YdhE family)